MVFVMHETHKMEKILLSVILASVIFSAAYSTYQDAKDKDFTREWRADIMNRLRSIESKTYGELKDEATK